MPIIIKDRAELSNALARLRELTSALEMALSGFDPTVPASIIEAKHAPAKSYYCNLFANSHPTPSEDYEGYNINEDDDDDDDEDLEVAHSGQWFLIANNAHFNMISSMVNAGISDATERLSWLDILHEILDDKSHVNFLNYTYWLLGRHADDSFHKVDQDVPFVIRYMKWIFDDLEPGLTALIKNKG